MVNCSIIPNHPTMLNQFRLRFPQGSLVSELLAIDHGKYVVRVLIEVEGVILASGLAAADTVESAEDRARNRALELLNWEQIEDFVEQQPSAEKTTPPVEKIREEVKDNSKSPPPPIAAKKTVMPAPSKKYERPSETIPEIPLDTKEITPPQLPPLETDSVGIENGNLKEITPKEEQLSSPTQKDVNSPQANLPHSDFPKSDSLDFSDIIARTDIELKRLNWTQEQGRDYLLSTYGKKSRLHLSDEELLEFLHYLETQP